MRDLSPTLAAALPVITLPPRDPCISQFLMRELADCGYAGAEVRNAPLKTEIIVRATQTKDVLGTATSPASPTPRI